MFVLGCPISLSFFPTSTNVCDHVCLILFTWLIVSVKFWSGVVYTDKHFSGKEIHIMVRESIVDDIYYKVHCITI